LNKVTDVNDPEGLGGINDNFASDLSKIVVTMEEEEGGKLRKLHLVVKAALQQGYIHPKYYEHTDYICPDPYIELSGS
jgi:hypothetical protein